MKRKDMAHPFAACLLVAAALLLTPLAAPPPAYSGPPDIQLLMIGNSFTRGVKRPLKSLIKYSGRKAKISSQTGNGATLQSHLGSARTRKKLLKTDWDYVILQEQSLGIYHSRYPAARSLDDLINDAGSRTMFFMTWRDQDQPLASYDSLRGEPWEHVGYVPIAHELSAPVSPVGWAFRAVKAAGIYTGLWGSDGHHPSRAGDYLAACTFYVMLFRESAVGLTAPGYLSAEQANYYQIIATQTVFNEIAVWDVNQ